MKKCQATSYCKLAGGESCNEYCGLYNLLKAIYSLSNLPLRYQYQTKLYANKVTKEAFEQLDEYRANVVDNVEQGKGLYIWSETTGNGKTTWATNIANQYIRKTVKDKRLEGLVLYINIPTYLERVRRSFDEPDNRLVEINEQLANNDLVIFDDIGAERPSDWVQEQLYRIINHRDNNLKASIFTSNASPDKLRTNLGDRTYSRIMDNQIVEIQGGDRRCLNNRS